MSGAQLERQQTFNTEWKNGLVKRFCADGVGDKTISYMLILSNKMKVFKTKIFLY